MNIVHYEDEFVKLECSCRFVFWLHNLECKTAHSKLNVTCPECSRNPASENLLEVLKETMQESYENRPRVALQRG